MVSISMPVLQQMLNTAVAAGQMAAADGRQGDPAAQAPTTGHKPKMPQFWEQKPQAWFRVFELHYPNATQLARFDSMLAFLSTAALCQIDHLIDDPPAAPYTKAKEALIRHFRRSKVEMAEELLALVSLGDRTPTDFLRYMRSLQPGEAETTLFRVVFLRCLPQNARDVATQKEDIDQAAEAAETVLAAPSSSRAVNALAMPAPLDSDDELAESQGIHAVSRPSRPARSRTQEALCHVHETHGANAYSCADPDNCKTKSILKKRPQKKR